MKKHKKIHKEYFVFRLRFEQVSGFSLDRSTSFPFCVYRQERETMCVTTFSVLLVSVPLTLSLPSTSSAFLNSQVTSVSSAMAAEAKKARQSAAVRQNSMDIFLKEMASCIASLTKNRFYSLSDLTWNLWTQLWPKATLHFCFTRYWFSSFQVPLGIASLLMGIS